jgi:hypothetical protein
MEYDKPIENLGVPKINYESYRQTPKYQGEQLCSVERRRKSR